MTPIGIFLLNSTLFIGSGQLRISLGTKGTLQSFHVSRIVTHPTLQTSERFIRL